MKPKTLYFFIIHLIFEKIEPIIYYFYLAKDHFVFWTRRCVQKKGSKEPSVKNAEIILFIFLLTFDKILLQ